ncbi:reverse transcriptase [Corchorus capsularis]|uniref:Reverse transcriptase n=1 Tax=Corchorus capsularis TaxID=210143 RepID=A0A1R3FZA7_COCAP|nr:reverse transcriptase [Corchorus capsularis]
MSKAYDRLEWNLLEAIMLKMGYVAQWVDMIMQCVRLVSFSVVVNGDVTDEFRPERGLRQGDLLSPYLFLMCTEGLSALLSKGKVDGLLSGVSASQRGPWVSHLFFVDDSLLFGKANSDESSLRMMDSTLLEVAIEFFTKKHTEASIDLDDFDADQRMLRQIWRAIVPPKIRFFSWCLFHALLPAMDNLFLQGRMRHVLDAALAKTHAVLRALSWVKEMGFHTVMIEGDALYIIQKLNSPHVDFSQIGVLLDDAKLLKESLDCYFFHYLMGSSVAMADSINLDQIKEADTQSRRAWNSILAEVFQLRSVSPIDPGKPVLRVLAEVYELTLGRDGLVKIIKIDSNLYVIQFPNEITRTWVLENEPWHIQNKPLFIKRWEPGGVGLDFDMRKFPLWITLKHVPLELYTKLGLSFIASGLGNPLYMDRATALKQKLSIAKVCVEVDLEVVIELKDGTSVSIEIEVPWRPPKCCTCNVFGHANCSVVPKQPGRQRWTPKKNLDIAQQTVSIDTTGDIADAGNISNTGGLAYTPIIADISDIAKVDNGMSLKPTVKMEVQVGAFTILTSPATVQKSLMVRNIEQNTPIGCSTAQQSDVQKGTGRKFTATEKGKANASKQSSNRYATLQTKANIIDEEHIDDVDRLTDIVNEIDKATFTRKPRAALARVKEVVMQCITCHITYNSKKFYFSAVYGANNEGDRRNLWSYLLQTATTIGADPWLVVGDFNVISRIKESSEFNGTQIAGCDISDFNSCISQLDLVDHAYSGPLFTWWNKRDEGSISKKLDRALVNFSWLEAYQNSIVEFLAPEVSDHCAILVKLDSQNFSPPKPFRFFNFWTKHDNFMATVKQSWPQPVYGRDPMLRLFMKLKRLKPVLKQFNRDNFRQLSDKVNQKRGEVAQLQTSLLQSASSQLVDELKQISDKAIPFFQSLLGKKDGAIGGCSIDLLTDILQDTVPVNLRQSLSAPVTTAEIKSAIFSISGDKAPGPNGFNSYFFKSTWSIVQKDVEEAILYFFQTGHLLQAFNSTAITLVPKYSGLQLNCEKSELFTAGVSSDIVQKMVQLSHFKVGSLWIAWIYAYILKGRSIMEIPSLQRYSWNIKKLLHLRNKVDQFIQVGGDWTLPGYVYKTSLVYDHLRSKNPRVPWQRDHIFFTCEYSKKLCVKILRACNLTKAAGDWQSELQWKNHCFVWVFALCLMENQADQNLEKESVSMETSSDLAASKRSKVFLKLKISNKPLKHCGQHICPVCSRGFSSGKALGGHIRIHTKGIKNSRHRKLSKLQPRNYIHRAKAKKRISKKTGLPPKAAADDDDLNNKDDDEDEKFSCAVCNKEFRSKKSLFGHMRNHPDRKWRGIKPPPNSEKNSCCSSVSENEEAVQVVDQISATETDEASADLFKSLPKWSYATKPISDEIPEAAYCLMKLARGQSFDLAQLMLHKGPSEVKKRCHFDGKGKGKLKIEQDIQERLPCKRADSYRSGEEKKMGKPINYENSIENKRTKLNCAEDATEVLKKNRKFDQFHKYPMMKADELEEGNSSGRQRGGKIFPSGFCPNKNPSPRGLFGAETAEGKHLYSKKQIPGTSHQAEAAEASHDHVQVCSPKLLDFDLNEPYVALDAEPTPTPTPTPSQYSD